MDRSPIGTFRQVRAEHVAADVVSTKRVDFDGVSLTGVMLQRIVMEITARHDGSSGDIQELVTLVRALSAQITALQTGATAMAAQVNTLTEQMANITNAIADLPTTVNVLSGNVTTVQTVVEALSVKVIDTRATVNAQGAFLLAAKPTVEALMSSAVTDTNGGRPPTDWIVP